MIDLIKGDCLEIMKSIPSGSIDAIITDPPYGTTACKWDSVINLELMWKQLKRIIKPNGAIVLFSAQPFTSALVMSNPKMFKYDWVWKKNRGTGHLNAKKQPMRDKEDIIVFYKKQCKYNPQGLIDGVFNNDRPAKNRGRLELYSNEKNFGKSNKGGYPKQVLEFDKIPTQKCLHPTQKPVALMEYLIKTYTNEKETVLDFTMGSGSTMVAAKNLNRSFIGIEQDENYFNIAKERINE